jgi:glycosyltransferase involved in cell wall biosynthesis
MIKQLKKVRETIQVGHLLVVMNRVVHDARTLNLARSLNKRGESVVIIGWVAPQDYPYLESLDIQVLGISPPSPQRMWRQWLQFLGHILPTRGILDAHHLWAMDLYALPFVLGLSRPTSGKIIYDAREIYSALGSNLGHPQKDFALAKIEQALISAVDDVMVTGGLDAQYLQDQNQITNTHLLMNLPPWREFEHDHKLHRRFNIPEHHRILIYQGMIHQGRGIAQAIQALTKLENVHLVAIGSGADVHEMRYLAKELNVSDRYHQFGPVPYDDLLRWTAAADLGLALFEPLTLSLEYSLPNKLFEYAMAGIPVLTTNLPQIEEIMEQFPAGEVIGYDHMEEKLPEVIEHLLIRTETGYYDEAITSMKNFYHWEQQEDIIDKILV